ncbi:hypothetical protein ABFX02_14G191700 [Erythranthe guttata]
MGDHDPPDGTFFIPSEDQEIISDGNRATTNNTNTNTNTPLIIISDVDDGDVPLLSLWGPPAAPPFSATLLQHETAAPAADDNYSDILNDLSTCFKEAPPLLRHADEILLRDLADNKGQSSGNPSTPKQDSHNHEDGAAKQVSRQYKRKHSGEAYNLSTRVSSFNFIYTIMGKLLS